MRYAILRTAKIKSPPGLVRAIKHDVRDHTPPNADPERSQDNTISPGGLPKAMAKFRALTQGVRMRKDSVVALEYLVTASPEAMQAKSKAEQDAYLYDSLDWIIKRHGKDNILTAGIHRDEKTPHLHVVVVPIIQSKDRWGKIGRSLSAKAFTGGVSMMRAMQTEFAATVGQRHGLERGLEGSRATHQTVRQFYGALSKETRLERSYELPKRGKPEEVEKIILEGLTVGLAAMQEAARTATADRRSRAEAVKANTELHEANRKLNEMLLTMPLEEIEKMREKLRAKEQAREAPNTRKPRGLER